ncbi:MAG: HhH-GPD-type base excision DNA repair protein [Ferrimicrobium sp.]
MSTGDIYLTPDIAANQYLRDEPFALLLGMLLDQQIPMERAFGAPWALLERIRVRHPDEDLTPCHLSGLEDEELVALFGEKPALHRFPRAMAEKAKRVAAIICSRYDGDAATLWTTAATGGELFERLRELPGFGDGKAKIFLALLAKRFAIKPSGWEEACAPFGEVNRFQSVADASSPEALAEIRLFKAALKSQRSS